MTITSLATALADRYRIERELGQGGMATVYLAHDIKHDRKVALKVLKPELAAVLGAERFVVEIRTTAALQHPHILPLFDSGSVPAGHPERSEGPSFLYYVMPFIQGETLRAKLDRETQLGVDEAVRIATDVADALQCAHEHGVIHRDIKPENILLANGRPMVADFGIALAVSAAAGGRMTETGLSLGTPHYMSPEQATADKQISARSDVYSLASVLYEMLAGQPPHLGGSAQQIIMKIITEPAASVTTLRKSVPPNVAAALARALEKVPADRFATAAEFAAALENPAFTTVGAGGGAANRAASPSRRGIAASALMTVAFAVLAGWAYFRPAPRADARPTRFTIPVPTGHVMREDETPNLALSPDGRTVVYATAGRLYKRSLGSESGDPIPGTEGAFLPFFSPDGKSIAFTQNDDIRRMSIDGGPATRVTGGSDLGADWGDDDAIVSTTRGALWRTPASGGASTQITTLASGESEHLWPQVLPGSRVLIFTVLGNTGLWKDARVVALDLASGRRVVIREQSTYGRFIPPGHVVYTDATGTISAIRFDPRRLTTSGDPVPVETGVRVGSWGGAAELAVSATGTVAFVRGSTLRSDVVWWMTRDGRRTPLGGSYSFTKLQLTPDGRQILTDPFVSSALDIFMMDATSGARDRVTFATPGTFSYEAPVLSPDGRRIAYAFQVNDDSMRVRTVSRDNGADAPLFTLGHHHHLQDWSPDGAWLLSEEEHPERRSDLIALRVDSVARRVVVAATAAVERSARFSPDGRWIAYYSNESGRDEVYVVSFPVTAVRRQVSTDGGRFPRWSRTSGELFYWRDSTLMAVRVTTGGAFERGVPTPVLTMGDADPAYERWDVTADGRRFLVAGRNPDAPARDIHVVVNWSAALETALKIERR